MAIPISGQLASAVPTGTAPATVASTTMVSGLNANYVGGIPLSGLVQALTANASPPAATTYADRCQFRGGLWNFSVVTTGTSGTTYWKVATLPLTSVNSFDMLTVRMRPNAWGTARAEIEIQMCNRGNAGVSSSPLAVSNWWIKGNLPGSAGVMCYRESDNSVSVYAVLAAQYLNFSVDAFCTGLTGDATIYSDPAYTTSPTGTKIFDTTDLTTYPPSMPIDLGQIRGRSAPIFSSLTGFLKGNGTSAVSAQSTVSLTSEVGGVLPLVNGGSGLSSAALGDIHYASATNTFSALAGNTTTTRKFLRQTGNGSISAAPAWDTLQAGDIPSLSGTYLALGGGTLTGALNGTAATFTGALQAATLIEQKGTFTPSGIGWYRLMVSTTSSSGRIIIRGFYDNGYADVDFFFTVNAFGGAGSITQFNSTIYNPVVDQARISSDGGNNIYLDVHVATSTAPAALTVYGYGPQLFGFLTSPTSGASAGSTSVQTVTFALGIVTTSAITSGGVVSASSFSGAGTSLTGTAASLSIGGNAATATTSSQLNGQSASYYLNAGNMSAGTLVVARGGSGLATITANGIPYGAGTSALGVTAAGSQYQTLQAGPSGVPVFAALSLGQAAAVTGQLGAANGGTGLSTVTTNGIPYGAGTGALGVTAAGTQYQPLQAGASGVPVFAALNLGQAAAITGTLPIGNGGTGLTSTSQNFAFIGPTSGAGAPTWRALVSGDIPSLSALYLALTGGTLTGTTTLSGASSVLSITSTYGGSTLQMVPSNLSAFSVNTSSGYVYFGFNTYNNSSAWTQSAPSGNTNSAVLGVSPGSGVFWWAANTTPGTWNVASGAGLWDAAGKWVGSLNASTGAQVASNTILHAGNYNSYAPTLTGTGASGTWGIGVTGSAAQLNGQSASYYLDTSSGGQSKSGRLNLGGSITSHGYLNLIDPADVGTNSVELLSLRCTFANSSASIYKAICWREASDTVFAQQDVRYDSATGYGNMTWGHLWNGGVSTTDLMQLCGDGSFWLGSTARFYFINGASPKVGIRQSAPTSNLESGGSFGTNVSTVTSKSITLTDAYYTVLVDTTASPANGNVTVTLPTASGCKGRHYVIKLIAGTGSAIIARSGSDTIDGATSQTISTLNGKMTVQSDGSNWWIIA